MSKRYRFAFKRMDVYQEPVRHFDWTCQVVDRMPKGPFRVTNQALSASLSIMGNIGEANGREKKHGEVQQHYRYAQGSTFESATHLDAFSSLTVIDDGEYNAEEERLARIAAMLTKLAQRQRRQAAAQRRRKREPAAHRRPATPAQPGSARNPAMPESRSEPGKPAEAGSLESERSEVPASPQGDAGIESSRSEVPVSPQGDTGIESRNAGPRGSAATEGDRTSKPNANP